MENNIMCVTGQENWCSPLLIAGLLHAQWAKQTVMTAHIPTKSSKIPQSTIHPQSKTLLQNQ